MSYDSTANQQPRDRRGAIDQEKFLSLFLRSEREIFRYVSVLVPNLPDADDIVQQTAVALWEKFDEYDPKQPFTPWACRFALNKAHQWVERRHRWKRLLDEGLAEQLLRRREEIRPELDQRLTHLDECLRKLPGPQRELVERYYHRREGVDQLAKAFDRSVAATYKMLQRIRQSLQVCIEDAVVREGID
jgi:RNA polymerase sigma-70 factor (ECF subfamily)